VVVQNLLEQEKEEENKMPCTKRQSKKHKIKENKKFPYKNKRK